jgi:hypothetical protein
MDRMSKVSESAYKSKIEIILSSLETRSNISTFLAGTIYIMIQLVISGSDKFVSPELYMLLLFAGAMLLTFASIFYFETSRNAKSLKSEPEDRKWHLEKIERLSNFGDWLYRLGTLTFVLANIWMLSNFGLVFVVISAIIGFSFLYVLIMKR